MYQKTMNRLQEHYKEVENMGYEIVGITLGNASGTPVAPTVYHGKWLHPGSTLYRYFIMPMLIRKGIRSYNKKHLLYMKTLQKG